MTQTIFSILLGVGLSAACGFRVFLPLLVMGLAARFGTGIFHLELAPGFAWAASTPVLIAFAVATVLEIAAYYVPWLDHALDAIAGPAAVAAGVLVTAAQLHGMDPALRWTLAAIAGGGAAAAVQLLTSGVRAASTYATAGCANVFIATFELFGALLMSLLAIVLPPLAVALAVLLVIVAVRKWRRARG
jgi:hypothetical protein